MMLLALILTIGVSFARTAADSGGSRIPLAQAQEAYRALTGKPSDEVPVILFVASWCPYCRALEQEFQRSGVNYARADIERNQRAADLYQRFGTDAEGGIPVTVVGERVIPGYQPEVIFAELNRLKQRKPASVI